MNKYEILSHTGDVKIRVFGSTKEELFRNALEGMGEILKPKVKSPSFAPSELRKGKQKSKLRKFEVRASDVNALLVDFLNEINYSRQVNKEVYNEVEFKKFLDNEVEGFVRGFAAEEFGEDIKAVTFHGLDIHKNLEGLWETDIVFDV